MAQKIGPASLRLWTNKEVHGLWMGSVTYTELLHTGERIHTFCERLFRQLGLRGSMTHVQASNHRLLIQSFVPKPSAMHKKFRHKGFHRGKVPALAYGRYAPFLHLDTTSLKANPHVYALTMAGGSKKMEVVKQGATMHTLLALGESVVEKTHVLTPPLMAQQLHLFPSSHVLPVKGSKALVSDYVPHVEAILSKTTGTQVVWEVYKMKHVFSSASFVAHYMAIQFETQRKKPFRAIFEDVVSKCIKHAHIVGVRVVIAGRIRNAAKASTQMAKYGQTSLHVFSHAIDYASTSAHSKNGLLGIKVWLSYTL